MKTSFSSDYLAFRSHAVSIGGLATGADNPVRLQSMTNTPTTDILSTARQTVALADAGCEMVRITARNVREARLLKDIRDEVRSRGCKVPLIADIHFLPSAALEAAKHVDKVRINPGNYMKYRAGAAAGKLVPLLDFCRGNGKAIRIGVNQGSLAPHILERFGNTVEGMVESALEFLSICHRENFHDLLISIKSSQPLTNVHAVRLLATRMLERGYSYPVHLGVTEAGFGTEGILRSVAGLVPLLGDGLGDTIRVSLTGDPLSEIPVAKEILRLYPRRIRKEPTGIPFDPYHHEKPLYEAPFDKPVIVGAPYIAGSQLFYNDQDLSVSTSSSGAEWAPSDNGRLFHMRRPLQEGWPEVIGVLEDGDKIEPEDGMFRMVKIPDQDENDMAATIGLAARITPLLFDGKIHGLWPMGTDSGRASMLLQAAGLRRTGTELIACPSCGRTNFDILSAAENVKERVRDFPGLKVAVMGCIVNGPGEMEDADYGYVGAGQGKVHIYRRGKLHMRDVPEAEAVERLVQIIEADLP